MSFKVRLKGAEPEKKADIVAAAREVLENSRALLLCKPHYTVGQPQFFGLYRKKLHVLRTINADGYQPFEKRNDRTLAFAIAILVADEKGPTKAETKWLSWADERGVICHVVKTWGEFRHAVGELSEI